jgi:hypothetical protein
VLMFIEINDSFAYFNKIYESVVLFQVQMSSVTKNVIFPSRSKFELQGVFNLEHPVAARVNARSRRLAGTLGSDPSPHTACSKGHLLFTVVP